MTTLLSMRWSISQFARQSSLMNNKKWMWFWKLPWLMYAAGPSQRLCRWGPLRRGKPIFQIWKPSKYFQSLPECCSHSCPVWQVARTAHQSSEHYSLSILWFPLRSYYKMIKQRNNEKNHLQSSRRVDRSASIFFLWISCALAYREAAFWVPKF